MVKNTPLSFVVNHNTYNINLQSISFRWAFILVCYVGGIRRRNQYNIRWWISSGVRYGSVQFIKAPHENDLNTGTPPPKNNNKVWLCSEQCLDKLPSSSPAKQTQSWWTQQKRRLGPGRRIVCLINRLVQCFQIASKWRPLFVIEGIVAPFVVQAGLTDEEHDQSKDDSNEASISPKRSALTGNSLLYYSFTWGLLLRTHSSPVLANNDGLYWQCFGAYINWCHTHSPWLMDGNLLCSHWSVIDLILRGSLSGLWSGEPQWLSVSNKLIDRRTMMIFWIGRYT